MTASAEPAWLQEVRCGTLLENGGEDPATFDGVEKAYSGTFKVRWEGNPPGNCDFVYSLLSVHLNQDLLLHG